MALDFMAIVSVGTYPIPTPTASQRAAYAITYGLLSTLPLPGAEVDRGIRRIGLKLKP